METPTKQRPNSQMEIDRVSNFQRMDEILIRMTREQICSIGKINTTSLGESSEANAYSVEIDPSLRIAAKIMKNTERNRREIKWYEYFMQFYDPIGFLHFPLISRYESCDVCSISKKYNQQVVKSVIAEDCIIMFSELANGDLTKTVGEMNENDIESMICQVLMALLVLENNEIVHNDLHFGNLLFHNQTIDLSYTDESFGVQIVIPSFGKVWVLWDFGMMVKNGEKDPRDDDIVIVDTFTNDWKMTFLPLLKKNFPHSPSVKKIDKHTKNSSSIRDVIRKNIEE